MAASIRLAGPDGGYLAVVASLEIGAAPRIAQRLATQCAGSRGTFPRGIGATGLDAHLPRGEARTHGGRCARRGGPIPIHGAASAAHAERHASQAACHENSPCTHVRSSLSKGGRCGSVDVYAKAMPKSPLRACATFAPSGPVVGGLSVRKTESFGAPRSKSGIAGPAWVREVSGGESPRRLVRDGLRRDRMRWVGVGARIG